MTNSCHFIGNLGADPKINTFGNGDKQATFSIGVSERWKDKSTGERKEHTTWINIVVNGGLANIAESYLRKGSKIYVDGQLRNRSYEKDGTTRYITEIRASNIQMLDGKSESQEPARDYAPQDNSSIDDQIPF